MSSPDWGAQVSEELDVRLDIRNAQEAHLILQLVGTLLCRHLSEIHHIFTTAPLSPLVLLSLSLSPPPPEEDSLQGSWESKLRLYGRKGLGFRV